MTPKNKGLLAIGVTFVLTAALPVLRGYDLGNIKAAWFIWLGVAWNYFAYAFDKQMVPWVWVELQGNRKGSQTERSVVFWITGIVHLAFLATMAFADK